MIQLLQIIRWKNLLMIAIVQMLIRCYLMPLYEVTAILSNWQFVLLVLASVLIAAAGYIINDMYDVETDMINKPSKVWIPTFLKEEGAKYLYYSITLLGFLFGVFLSFSSQSVQSIIWFLIPVFLVYLYAIWAKKVLILGNIIVSLLAAYSLFIIVLFETNILKTNVTYSLNLGSVVWFLVLFAFIMTFIREIIKDMEDVEGDKAIGASSIPIKYGIEKTKMIVRNLARIVMGIIGAIAFIQYSQQPVLVGYLIFGVLVSMLLFINQLRKAKMRSNYKRLSSLLKIIMFIGMLAVFTIKPI